MNHIKSIFSLSNIKLIATRYVSDVATTANQQHLNFSLINSSKIDKLYKTVELELKGNDLAVLKSYIQFATTTGKHLNIKTNSWFLRKPLHERLTVLKSVHIYKKHRVQYETRTYFSFIQFNYLTESTADTLLEYVERNLPEGVALKATKVEIQSLPQHLKTAVKAF